VRKVLEWLGFRRSPTPEGPPATVPEPSPYASQTEADAEDMRREQLEKELQDETESPHRRYDA
jgi:hypothetical protein